MENREHNEEYFYVHGKDIYSTQSLLASLGVKQSDTIYKNSSNDFIRWPFSAANFFEIVEGKAADLNNAENLLEENDRIEVEKINSEIKSYKNSGDTIANKDRIKELRTRKKEILSKIDLSKAGKGSIIDLHNRDLC